MQTKPTILVAPCSYQAAKHAILNWHYSKRMPFGKINRFGAWENNQFIGAITYGYSASPMVCKSFNLKQNQMCELTRVALTDHITPVSKIIAITIRLLKKKIQNCN